MLSKKTRKANIEKQRSIYLQTGLIFALAITLVAFQWTSHSSPSLLADADVVDVWDIPLDIPMTEQKKELIIRPDVRKTSTTVAPIFEITETNEEPADEQPNDFDADDLFGDEEDEYYAGSGTGTSIDTIPFVIVEDMPVLCECEQFTDSAERADCNLNALFSHLHNTIKVPSIIIDSHKTQTAYVYFVVDQKGNVTDVKVRNSERVFKAVSKEAMRAISTMPCWKPGKQRGKPVKVQFTVPIKFMGL